MCVCVCVCVCACACARAHTRVDAEGEHSPDSHVKKPLEGFPGGAVVENLPANAGDTGSSPGLGRSHMLWSN